MAALAGRGGPGARRRPDADPDAEAAAGAARRRWWPDRHRRDEGRGHAAAAALAHRRRHHPRRRWRARRRRTIRRSPRWRRGSATRGAQPRHDRRQPRQQRPLGLLSGGGAGARARRSSPTRREIAADDFFQGMFTTALEPGEIITEVRFPIPRAGELREVPPAGLALRAGRRSSSRSSRDGVRVAVTGASESGVFRWTEAEAALSGDFSPEAVKGMKPTADGHDRRPARHAGVPRASRRRADRAGRGGGGLTLPRRGARRPRGGTRPPARPARGGRPPWASLRRSGRSGRDSVSPRPLAGPRDCPIGFHASMIPCRGTCGEAGAGRLRRGAP